MHCIHNSQYIIMASDTDNCHTCNYTRRGYFKMFAVAQLDFRLEDTIFTKFVTLFRLRMLPNENYKI